jgi:hypothetical protein
MLTRRSPLSSLPACTDFDIEKMRPEWRDEVLRAKFVRRHLT